MSMFDQLMEQARGLDLGAVAQRVGLSQEQVAGAARALLPQIADPQVDNAEATAAVAADTGISPGKLAEMVPALLEQARAQGATGGALGNVLAGLGSDPGAMLGNLKGALDRDGDGNPINDVLGMFNRS
jgi:hypothetical protein